MSKTTYTNLISKLNNIIRLDEANKEVSIEWIKEHCSDAITSFRNGQKMYKGMNTNMPYFLRTENKTRRKAAYAKSNLHTNIINRSSEFAGFPKREHIGTTDPSYTMNYGTQYIMLPVNGSKVGICPEHDVWFSFEHMTAIGFTTVNEFYTVVGICLSSFGLMDLNYDTVSGLKNVFKYLNKRYNEMDEYERNKAIDKVWYTTDHSSRRAINDYILKTVADGKVSRILSLFKKTDAWELQTVDNLSLPPRREVWCDGQVVYVLDKFDDNYKAIFEQN